MSEPFGEIPPSPPIAGEPSISGPQPSGPPTSGAQPSGPPPSGAQGSGTGGSSKATMIVGALAVIVAVLAVLAVLTTRSSDESDTAGPSGGSKRSTTSEVPTSAAADDGQSGSNDSNQSSTDGSTDSGAGTGDMVDTHAVTVTGNSLEELDYSGGIMPADRDGATGKVAPTVTGVDIEGQPSSIGKGKAAVYVFVAHWCPHCQREVPEIVKWAKAGVVPDSVDLVAIPTATQADQNNYPPSDWLVREDWPGRTLVDSPESEAAQAYGLPAFPYFVAVGADGTVVARGTGELTEKEFTAVVTAAAEGKPAQG